MRETEREAETQAEGEAGSTQEAWCGTWSQDPGITPWAEGRCSTTEPPRYPNIFFLIIRLYIIFDSPFNSFKNIYFIRERWLECDNKNWPFYLRTSDQKIGMCQGKKNFFLLAFSRISLLWSTGRKEKLYYYIKIVSGLLMIWVIVCSYTQLPMG